MRRWLPPCKQLSSLQLWPANPSPRNLLLENSWLALLGSCPSICSVVRVHGWLITCGLAHNVLCQTKLASVYASMGDMGNARAVFDALQCPDLYSWRVMFGWYLKMEQYSEIFGFYRHMRQCTKVLDNIVVSGILKACSESSYLRDGEMVHCDIIKMGNPDDFVVNGLICMYAECGEVQCSRKLFDEFPDRNVVSWTAMINGYVQNGQPEEGFVLFNMMRNAGTEPNEFTLGSLLVACSKLEALQQGRWIHSHMIKCSRTTNYFLVTGLLDMYAKCGVIIDARGIFDELHVMDLVSWTAMIVGYVHGGYLLEALKLFTDVRWAEIVPNSVTVASILSVSAQSGDPDLGKTIHGQAIKLGLDEETEVRNALVSMYTKCSMILDASCIFGRNQRQNDVVAWNAMMAGYAQNGLSYETLLMFRWMRQEGHFPDAVTFVNLLSSCASLGSLWLGSAYHAYAVKYGVLSNVYVGTALVNLYAKSGDAMSARSIFDGMSERNKVTWCAMIGGYGLQGDSTHSLLLFKEMLGDMQPNDVAFTSILSACGHTGMVSEGQKYFQSMFRDHRICPSVKHYTSFVDLLSRAGRLEEALEFIQCLPLEVDASILGAFIHGCQLHSRMELGEAAMGRMLELHPQNASYYQLMSNLYSSQGKWNDAAKVRELMKSRGLYKTPGSSSVEMDFVRCSVAL